jgi:putative addiction module component (TIGR02574 family)
MVAGFEEITQVALTLPLDERAKVASALLASLDEPADDPAEVEAAWATEIDRRARDVLSGKVEGIPWDTIRAELAERRRARG